MKTGFLALPFAAACILGSASLAPSWADSDTCRAGNSGTLLSEAALREKVAALGYEVWRIELDDGCYEVEARDAGGAYVELDLDSATGKLLGREVED